MFGFRDEENKEDLNKTDFSKEVGPKDYVSKFHTKWK